MKGFAKVLSGALTVMVAIAALTAPGARADFGLKELQSRFIGEGGASALLAGVHPFAVDTAFSVNTEPEPILGYEVPQGPLRDLSVFVPPGLAGNPTATPRCSPADFVGVRPDKLPGGNCPPETAIGVTINTVIEPGVVFTSPVYNLEPPPGVVAEIGFWTTVVPLTIELTVNPNPPYNVEAHSTNLPEIAPIYSAKVKLWGEPWQPIHDAERGECAR